MKCKKCGVKISCSITVRLASGKLVGPYCERCAEAVAANDPTRKQAQGTKEAA